MYLGPTASSRPSTRALAASGGEGSSGGEGFGAGGLDGTASGDLDNSEASSADESDSGAECGPFGASGQNEQLDGIKVGPARRVLLQQLQSVSQPQQSIRACVPHNRAILSPGAQTG